MSTDTEERYALNIYQEKDRCIVSRDGHDERFVIASIRKHGDIRIGTAHSSFFVKPGLAAHIESMSLTAHTRLRTRSSSYWTVDKLLEEFDGKNPPRQIHVTASKTPSGLLQTNIRVQGGKGGSGSISIPASGMTELLRRLRLAEADIVAHPVAEPVS